MTIPHSLRRCAASGLFLAAALAANAVDKGGTVYSKRNETNLLAEPKPLASAVGKAGFAEALKVVEVRGTWLKVTGKAAAGWVFGGNVANDKPTLAPPAGLTSIEASDTNTAAAARPLAPAANTYAERHGAGDPRRDVEWIDAQAAKLSPAAITTYLKTHKKGEYQE
jgi:hypothetical protein